MIIDGQNKAYKVGDKIYHCGTSLTMSLIGGKWKCVVLWFLRSGSLRFSELNRLTPYLTEKTLSLQLKSLHEDGLIARESVGTKAPFCVHYKLTELGESLLPVIKVITQWGTEFASTKGEIVNDQIN